MPTPNMRLWIRSPSDLIYNYALSSAYKSTYVYEPSLPLSRDPDIWEVVQSDPVIMSAMDRRMRAIVREWRIEYPGQADDKKGKEAAAICEDGIRYNLRGFNSERRRLAQAHFLGRDYEFVEGDRFMVSLAGGPKMDWWLPTRLRHIDRRRFHWTAEWNNSATNPKKKVHLEMYSENRMRWERVGNDFRRALIEYVYADTEDRLGYGRGMLESIYFYHYFKTIVLQRGMEWLDRFANGILIGKIDSMRNASSSKTNEALKTSMKTMLENMRTNHIAIMGQEDDIDIKESGGQGYQAVRSMLEYLDQSIERLMNGSIMPSGHASESGSKARAGVEADTSEAFYQDDRDDMDRCLTNQLVRLFWDNNRVNFAKLGMSDVRLPEFSSKQEKRKNTKELAEVMNSVLDHGLGIVKEEYYGNLDLSVPTEDDEVVTASMVGGAPGLGPDGMPFEVGFKERELEHNENQAKQSNELEQKKLASTEKQSAEKKAKMALDVEKDDVLQSILDEIEEARHARN